MLVHGGRYKGLLRPVVARHLPGLGLEDQRKDYPGDIQKRKLLEMQRSMSEVWPEFNFGTLDGLGVLARRGGQATGGEERKAHICGHCAPVYADVRRAVGQRERSGLTDFPVGGAVSDFIQNRTDRKPGKGLIFQDYG